MIPWYHTHYRIDILAFIMLNKVILKNSTFRRILCWGITYTQSSTQILSVQLNGFSQSKHIQTRETGLACLWPFPVSAPQDTTILNSITTDYFWIMLNFYLILCRSWICQEKILFGNSSHWRGCIKASF